MYWFFLFCSGAIAFNFNCSTLKLCLTDNRNAHINTENFNDIVQKYSNSGSFYVNIDVTEENRAVPIVSVKVRKHNLNRFASFTETNFFFSVWRISLSMKMRVKFWKNSKAIQTTTCQKINWILSFDCLVILYGTGLDRHQHQNKKRLGRKHLLNFFPTCDW